ncbi:hypothetical protein QR680_006477 [Steinernema hermaphroditum]|uniref:Uncharacterized protein n=1 Tax=Steinernema hermaphroditum TaxID=289476 RepID=A0AA39HX64_9BILA|nr:hypothetical protein QR680_006477 [Steinernema hermaphroditum]
MMLFAAFFPIFKCILLAFLFQIGAIVDTFDLTTELYTIGIFFRFLSSLWTSSAKATRSARRLLAQAHMRSSVSGIAKLTISYTKRYEGWQHCAVNMSSSSYFRALVEKAKEEHVTISTESNMTYESGHFADEVSFPKRKLSQLRYFAPSGCSGSLPRCPLSPAELYPSATKTSIAI